jgi:hypothetical protein
MTPLQFFGHDVFSFPLVFSDNFRLEVKSFLANYLKLVDQLKGSNDEISVYIYKRRGLLKRFCNSLIKCIDHQYNGFPSKSFHEFGRAIKIIQEDFNRICFDNQSANSLEPIRNLYRARIGDLSLFSKKDLFHIPFEKVRNVGSQRFSIVGLPCLYLGSSTYICWEELGRPNLDSLHFSKYMINQEERLNYINLSLLPNIVISWLNGSNAPNAKIDPITIVNAQTLGICWPLISTCLVKVNSKSSPFIPEYIIPQLLLQFVREAKYDGIMYDSTIAYGMGTNYLKCRNFVFPAQEIASEGYCQALRKKFLMTEPLSWTIADVSNPIIPIILNRPISTAQFRMTNDMSVLYENSKFGHFEKILDSLEAFPMD